MDLEEALRVESLRLYDRYEREIVEGLGFCPYALGAREAGRVQVVSVPRAALPSDVAVVVESIAANPVVDIGIVVLPVCALDQRGFSRFVAEVRELVPARDGGSFALADFHPDPVASVERPGDLTTFARRSPDPTIQLVRMRALSQVRARDSHGSGYMDPSQIARLELLIQSGPSRAPLHETIADHNRATIDRLGFAEIVRRIEDIHHDRDLTYRRLRAEAGHDRRADIG